MRSYGHVAVMTVGLIGAAGLVARADGPHREYGWTRVVGGGDFDRALGMALDDQGRIYVDGLFFDRIDLDPFKSKAPARSKGVDDIFVLSLMGDGDYRWHGAMGGTSYDGAFDCAIRNVGMFLATGAFQNGVDFDPTPGKDRHKSVAPGNVNVFVSLFGQDGSYGWTRTFGGTRGDIGYEITSDSHNAIIVVGRFTGTSDFDPGRGVVERTSVGNSLDEFISKLDADGQYQWCHTFGGILEDVAWAVATDDADNIIAVGDFRETVDFDARGGGDVRRAAGESDVFVIKVAADGRYLWTRTIGGADREEVEDVVVDDGGNIYYAGFFFAQVDFDPTEGVDIRRAKGVADVFVSSLDADGNYRWTVAFGGRAGDTATGLAISSFGELAVGGAFDAEMDFDPGEGVDWRVPVVGPDAFVCRYTLDGQYQMADT